MNLAGFSIRRPVAVSMIVLGILLLGFVSLQKIPLNLLPDITYPKITVRTEYPHAAPREVEERVTKLIESYVGIINNVVKISSVSRPGWSDVYIEFTWGSDVDVIAMDIREKLQLIQNFLPEEVERPVLLRYDPNQDPIMVLAVGGDLDLADLRRWAEMNVELEIERLDGVAAVKIEGGYEDEIMVEMDEGALVRQGLRVSTIADRLRNENLNIASGSLDERGSRLAVRTINRFASIEDIKNVIVAEKGKTQTESESSSSTPDIALGGMALGGGMGGMGGSGFPAGLASLLGNFGSLAKATAGMAPAEEGPRVTIRVKDVAKVYYRHKDRTEIARLNGQECIKVSIFKEGDANIVLVARAVTAALDEIRNKHRSEPRTREWERELRSPVRGLKKAGNKILGVLFNQRPFVIPEEPIELDHNIQIEPISDQSVFILQAIYSVAQNAIWGSLFAVLVLYFFLRNLSSTLIVGIAIPISFIATFILMYFNGISFNIMSLGGLALGVGMLVDCSIVVIENILRHRSQDPDLLRSAYKGTQEVAMPVTSGTLTNIIVFLPILYLEGMFRQFFKDLAWTVAFSTICSLVVSLSLVPMLTVVLGRWVRLPTDIVEESEEEDKGKPVSKPAAAPLSASATAPLPVSPALEYQPGPLMGCLMWPLIKLANGSRRLGRIAVILFHLVMNVPLRIFDVGFSALRHSYPRALERLLRHPFLVSGLAVGVAVASISIISNLGWELLPPVDQGEFRIRVDLPTGAPIEETNRRVAALENKIRAMPLKDDVVSIFTTVGIGLAEGGGGEERAENVGEIHLSLRDVSQRTASDETVIREAMKALADEVDLTARSTKPQLLSYKAPVEIEIAGNNLDRLRAAADLVVASIRGVEGLSEVESSMAESNPEVNIRIDRARASALGLSVSEITEAVRLKVKGTSPTRFDQPDRQLDITLELAQKDRASIEDLRRLTIPGAAGPVLLSQVAEIRAGLGPAAVTRSENSRVAIIRANLHGRPLGDVVRDIEAILANAQLPNDTIWRITGQNEEMKRSLPGLYLAMALAMVLVYIGLAAEFESLAHPFIIMFCVPFCLIGLAVIFFLTGQTINVFTLIGILMLIGIIDNVAIVMISAINLNRDYGMERKTAIIEACKARLRPILITTLTTVLGMTPLAIAAGPGDELGAPMAITVIGGLSAATVLSLLVIPCLYLALDIVLPRTYKPHPLEDEDKEEKPAPAASPGASPAAAPAEPKEGPR